MGTLNSKQKETREQILDTAEVLFAADGFRNVSLRRITTEAEVNIAAVNYHFGSKEALVSEVLSRVISPINEERLRLLNAAEEKADGSPLTIETLLDCMIRPVVNQIQQSPHKDSAYLKLAGRCLSEPAENFSGTLLELFREVTVRFMSTASEALPGLGEEDLFWRMHFSVGTMLYALTHGDRIVIFSEGKIPSPEAEEILWRLIDFTAAGLRAEASRMQKKAGRKKAAVATALAALAVLPACETTPAPDAKHHATVEAPAHWAAGPSYRPAHVPDHHWIDSFRESSLTSFVDSVLAHNKDLKAAQARIEIARANARIVGADLYPQINGNFSGRRNLQNFIGLPFPGAGNSGVLSSRSNQFGLSLDMSWELDLWGRIAAAKKATIADFEASQFDRATAELSLAGQAAKAWFALAEARDQIELSRRAISIFSKTESVIRDRFEAGVAANGQNSASQLLLAEADVATARNTLASRRELFGRTSRQLEILAGKYPAGQAGSSARLPSYPDQVPTGLPATLLDRRPDLAASERRMAAADERLFEARRSLLPAISLTGKFGSASEDISDLLDGTFSVWSIAGNLAQPIVRGGALRANVKKKDAELELAAAEFERTALTAFGEVENALAADKFFTDRVVALVQTVRLTEDAYDRSLSEFQNGTGDLLTVLSAQQRLFTSRSELLTVRRLRLDNRVDLYLALGGSFDPKELPPEKSPTP